MSENTAETLYKWTYVHMRETKMGRADQSGAKCE